MSQTPIFDKAINEILIALSPHQRTCPQCGSVFDIFQEDIEFYKKLKVSPPTLCPSCRLQRRLGHRLNLLPIFYKKTCAAPNHQEKILSFFSEKNPVKVYDDQYYFSDKWEALECARDYDFQKTFFEQFHQLALVVPHKALFHDPKSVNCDYVVGGVASKNCYYVGVPYRSENIYYGSVPAYCKDCLEVMDSDNCEQCYEIVYCEHCYNCHFCQECRDCLNSWFLYDCRGCSFCFGCVNLRNKQYYFLNQPLNKEEYQHKINEIKTESRKVLREYQTKFSEILHGAIRKGINNVRAQNSLGDLLRNCRNCFYCFRILSGGGESLRYVSDAEKVADLMDVFGSTNSSLCYESTGIGDSSQIKFSLHLRANCREMEYCVECQNSQYCFGCIGLKNKQYCIFNKQHSEQDYWQTVDKIKSDMLERGEYGQFFPLSISLMPYQDSTAQIEFPLTKEEIIKNNWHWQDEVASDIDLSKFQTVKTEGLPDDIVDVSDDILDKVILCEQTGKPFRLTKFELDFYRSHKLPLPAVHPLQRIKNRFAFRHPFKLWQYPCSNCGRMMYSGWDPAKKYKVYCERCYLDKVV